MVSGLKSTCYGKMDSSDCQGEGEIMEGSRAERSQRERSLPSVVSIHHKHLGGFFQNLLLSPNILILIPLSTLESLPSSATVTCENVLHSQVHWTLKKVQCLYLILDQFTVTLPRKALFIFVLATLTQEQYSMLVK